jgi:hypothetical protein
MTLLLKCMSCLTCSDECCGVASGASGSTSGNGNEEMAALQLELVVLQTVLQVLETETDRAAVYQFMGGLTHQGCSDAIGSICFNPP